MPSLRARSLMELITVTRATTASYCNSAGLLAQAAAGVARIDFDPVTRVSRGLLVEEARTNLLLRSAEFDNAAWTKAGATVVANARLAPDGTIAMDKIEEDTSTNAHYASQAYTKTSSTEVQAYALSCWAYPGERSWVRLVQQGSGSGNRASADFDVASGSVLTPSSAGGYDSAMAWIEPWLDANGKLIYRCCLTFRINNDGQAVTTSYAVLLQSGGSGESYTGTTGSGAYVWGMQLEKGPFPTSYIPTTTAAVTRNDDNIKLTSLSPWLEDEAAGTIVAEYSVPWTYSALDSVSRRIIEINSDANNRHLVYLTSGKIRGLTTTAGVGVATDFALTNQPARNTVGRVGWAWQKDNFARAVNGSVDLIDSAGDVPSTLTLAQLAAGVAGGGNLCGHLRRFRFYPRRVSNAELQQLTKAA